VNPNTTSLPFSILSLTVQLAQISEISSTSGRPISTFYLTPNTNYTSVNFTKGTTPADPSVFVGLNFSASLPNNATLIAQDFFYQNSTTISESWATPPASFQVAKESCRLTLSIENWPFVNATNPLQFVFHLILSQPISLYVQFPYMFVLRERSVVRLWACGEV